MKSTQYLAINRCPTHGYYSVTIDDAHGGTRLTPSKCCGRWDLIHRWPLDERGWRSLIAEAEDALAICKANA